MSDSVASPIRAKISTSELLLVLHLYKAPHFARKFIEVLEQEAASGICPGQGLATPLRRECALWRAACPLGPARHAQGELWRIIFIFISSESGMHIPVEMVHYGMTKTAEETNSAHRRQQDALEARMPARTHRRFSSP
jgi:hypothetical protein